MNEVVEKELSRRRDESKPVFDMLFKVLPEEKEILDIENYLIFEQPIEKIVDILSSDEDKKAKCKNKFCEIFINVWKKTVENQIEWKKILDEEDGRCIDKIFETEIIISNSKAEEVKFKVFYNYTRYKDGSYNDCRYLSLVNVKDYYGVINGDAYQFFSIKTNDMAPFYRSIIELYYGKDTKESRIPSFPQLERSKGV